MRTPILPHRTDVAVRDTARALRLIRKIEDRYGLQPLATPAFVDANGDPVPEPAGTNLHDLLIHQLQLKEEEHKRLSVEIHDALGQNLMALRLDVAALSQATGAGPPSLQAWVGAALDNIDGAIVTVRALIAALRPFEIELGLEAAVEHELSQFRRTSGIACHLGMEPGVRELPLTDDQILTLYRALQECLSNVVRHARATRVDVILRVLPSALAMAVSDNGVGLPRSQRRPPGGYGLQAVRERLVSLGGTVALKSVRSHGTTVSVCIPLAAPQSATGMALSDKTAN